MTTTITIDRVSGTDLHHHYHGQIKAQPCYVQLDPRTGELSASYDAEIGSGTPEAVYHGRLLRWSLPRPLRATAANELLAEIAPLAARVVEGFSVQHDAQANKIGVLDEDAEEASDAIERLCDDVDEEAGLRVWDAGEWLAGTGSLDHQCAELGITATTTDEELAAVETRVETLAADDDEVDALEGVAEYVERLRQRARDEAPACVWTGEHTTAWATTTDHDGHPACAAHADCTEDRTRDCAYCTRLATGVDAAGERCCADHAD